MAKTIGMILDAFYPSDIRVQKEASALISEGFDVVLLCKRREGEDAFEEVEGIQVMRINSGVGHTAKGIMDMLLAVFFIHPIFAKNLPAFISKYSVSALHVHDLPLVKTAIRAAKKHGIRVVSDFHENYPEALNVWFQWKKNPIIRLKNKIFFGYDRWNRYEKWACINSDYIIAVVDEMKARLISMQNAQEEKIVVISNTEAKDFIKHELDESIYGEDDKKFIVAYTGGVGPHRGVDTAVKALGLMPDYKEIILYIVGTISDASKSMLESLVLENDLAGRVKILGYKPFSMFYSYMKMASVNIIPHHSNGHTDNTIPHKLFQSMLTGNPLLVSSSTPLKRVVETTNSGLVFTAGDPVDLKDKLVKLYNHSVLRDELGKNGKTATLTGHYNWETSAHDLVKFYKSIL